MKLIAEWFNRMHSLHLPSGSIRRSLASGAFWSTVGAVASRGCVMLSAIIIARLLGKEGYGRWGIVMGTASMFAQFGSLGLGMASTNYVAKLRKKDPVRAGHILSLILATGLLSSSLMAVVCLIGARWLASTFYADPILFVPLLIASILLCAMLMTRVWQAALAGFESFRLIAKLNLIQGVTLLVMAMPLTWWLGLPGTALAATLSWGIAGLLSVRLVMKLCRAHGMPMGVANILREKEVLWQYAVPSLLTTFFMGPAEMISQSIVARTPGGMIGLGGFEAARRWRNLVLFVPDSIRRVTLPILSRIKGEGEPHRYVKALWANIAINGGVALIGAIPLIIFSPWILGLFGQDFQKDWDMMVILVGAGVLQAVNSIITQVYASMNKMWWRFAVHVVWGVQLVTGTVLLVPRYGARGLAYSLVAAIIVHLCLNSIAVWYIIRNQLYNSTGLVDSKKI